MAQTGAGISQVDRPKRRSRAQQHVCMQGETSDSGRSAGCFSKEVHKDSFGRHGVLVGQDANRASLFQNLKGQPRRFVLEDRLIP